MKISLIMKAKNVPSFALLVGSLSGVSNKLGVLMIVYCVGEMFFEINKRVGEIF